MKSIKDEFLNKSLKQVDRNILAIYLIKNNFNLNQEIIELIKKNNYTIINSENSFSIKDEINQYCLLLKKKENTISLASFENPNIKSKDKNDKTLEVFKNLAIEFDDSDYRLKSFSYTFEHNSTYTREKFQYGYYYSYKYNKEHITINIRLFEKMKLKIAEELKEKKYLSNDYFETIDLMYDYNNYFINLYKENLSQKNFEKNKEFKDFLLNII